MPLSKNEVHIKMVEAYILMTVSTGKELDVLRELKKLKEVLLGNVLYGEWDVIIKVKTDILENLDPLVTGNIRVLKDVKTTMTMIVADYNNK